MAYFPNGTSGEMFQDRYCCHCRHFRDRESDGYPVAGHGGAYSCPIFDVHFLSSAGYDWRGDDPGEAGEMVCSILDLLIQDEPPKCWMFEQQEKDG